MPKRTFWLVAGVALGAGSSLWAERKVKRTVEQAAARLQPDALVVEVGRSARQVAGNAGGRVRQAVSTGRDEMLRREEELWADLAAQGVDHDRGPVRAPALATAPVEPVDRPSDDHRPDAPTRRRGRSLAKSASHLDK